MAYERIPICAMVKSRYIGDGHPTFNRNPYNWYINYPIIGLMTIPYYMEMSWELIDPGTYNWVGNFIPKKTAKNEGFGLKSFLHFSKRIIQRHFVS